MRLSICSLTGCVVVALSLLSCSRTSVSGVEIDRRLKGYILPKSKVLAGLNFEEIKKTDFFKRHQAQLLLSQLDQLPAQIGMDPRKDLSSFLFTWDGTSTLVMTRGSFDSEQVEKRLIASAAPSLKYNKLTLYGDGKRDLVLLPKGVALVGPVDVLKNAADENATGGGGVSEDLQLQLARLNKGSQAWVVSSGVIPVGEFPMRNDAATTFSSISDYINATAIGVTLSGGARLDAHVSCISEEGSQRVHDALRGVIGLARLSTHDDQLDQLKIWDSIHVVKQGKDVQINADLTPEVAEKLITLLPGLTRRVN